MAEPTNKKLYELVKKEIYDKYPKHSLFRSAMLVKTYKARGGEYKDVKHNSDIDKWFNENWISINDYYHDNNIVNCGSSDTKKKFNEYPLCRPLKTVKSLTKNQMKEMIEEKNKLGKNHLIMEKVFTRRL
jgi:hypothetical protein